ncbi:MAG: hypothetical protein ACAI43_06885 [Phycisphaerae bacterium]|nr:hypothetical protein [Tepidisphaeraceae bacterium]
MALPVLAAPPAVDSISPAGGQRGTTVKITAAGKFDAWPAGAWADSPSIKIEAAKEKGAFTVTIAADAPVGPHLMRFFTPEGVSAPRTFVVGEHPEVAEKESKDDSAKAQPVDVLPTTINGVLDPKGDVDSFAVKLDAAQMLVATVQGRRLGSPIDSMLHVLGPDGRQVAFSHDGLGIDPLLAYKAEAAGVHTVRVSAFAYPPASDVKFAGGKDAIYRLTLTTGPFILATTPSGVTRGKKTDVTPLGWNVGPAISVDTTTLPADSDHVSLPGGDGLVRIDVSDALEITQATAGSTPHKPPVAITGTIAKPAEEDTYTIRATKGAKLAIAARSLAPTYALDPTLRIADAAGKQLAADDGAGTGSAKVEWAASADGEYRVTIGDLFQKGGRDLHYRLDIRPVTPSVSATVPADSIALAPGKTATIKVTVARKNGHAEKLAVTAIGLPHGVTAAPVGVPDKPGDVTLSLVAAADAKPANGPFRIVLATPGAAPDKTPIASATVTLVKAAEKAPALPWIEQTSDLWLTVGAKATDRPPEPKK